MDAENESIIKFTNDELLLICRRYFLDQSKISEKLNKLKIIAYDIKRLSETPLGFLGEHNTLRITYQLKSNVNAELSVFTKTLPQFSDYVKNFNGFNKEICLYQFLLPRLQDVTIGSKKWAPNCYLTRSDNLLVMENLNEEDFQMAPKTNGGRFDYDHLVVALKTLARFHASTIIFEERTHRKIPQHYPGYLKENAYPSVTPEEEDGSIRVIGFKNACAALVALAKLIPKYRDADENVKQRIEIELPVVLRQIFVLCQPSKVYRNVVNHGDLWSNNILFRYDEKLEPSRRRLSERLIVECEIHDDSINRQTSNGTSNKNSNNRPIDARLVDFQLARYAPPILDVVSLISITTNTHFREKYMEKLLEHYYECLIEEIQRHDIDIDDVLNKRELIESYNSYRLAGLIESCLFSHLTLLPESMTLALVSSSKSFDEFIQSSGRSQICVEAFNQDENYRLRMSDMLMEIVDNYVILN